MTDSNVGQPAHPHHAQLVGSKHDPAVGFLAARAESTNAAIRSRVFGPEHDRLSFLHKLHILACDPSYESIRWTSDGKSFEVKRMGYTRDIMNVFFDQTKFKSFQNRLSRYRFKVVRNAKFSNTRGFEYDYIINHPLFTREKFDVVAMQMARGGKKIAYCSEKWTSDEKLGYGVANGARAKICGQDEGRGHREGCSKLPPKGGNSLGHEKTISAVPGEVERPPRPAEGCEVDAIISGYADVCHSQTNIIGHAAARRSPFPRSFTMTPKDPDDEEIANASPTARGLSMVLGSGGAMI
ncbi:hypothetical protein ACHAW5_004233 [Stephanodiscus triporus]|uniref:HSF-type DNA-binding domain-containing protein n=1 Tax=Stephanodiscus triporus TaxID=2934178 RepID=A0ABD3NL76_9STRA